MDDRTSHPHQSINPTATATATATTTTNNQPAHSSSLKRLTRSTYIDQQPIKHSPDNHTSNGNSNAHCHQRCDSDDSENGWIPPPPLLPLNTRFSITTSETNLNFSERPESFDKLTTPNDPIPTWNLNFLNLRYSSSDQQPQSEQRDLLNRLGYRLLDENELYQSDRRVTGGGGLKMMTINRQQRENFQQTETNIFNRLHRQSELLEKRSKRLEKEKLLHARFKLKAHLEMLINGSGTDWKSIRSLSLKRIKEDELMERNSGTIRKDERRIETESEKLERVRQVMIKEAEETLRRYEKILDTRKLTKPKVTNPTQANQKLTSTVTKPAATTTDKTVPPHSVSSPGFPNVKSTTTATRKVDAKPQNPILRNVEHRIVHPPSLNRKFPLSRQPSSSDDVSNKIKALKDFKSKRPRVEELRSSTGGVEPVGGNGDNQKVERPSIFKSQDNQVSSSSSSVTTKMTRESLYESASIRRLALEEHTNNNQRRIGRSSYALGCRFPDLSCLRLDYQSRLKSMVINQSSHLLPISIPFERPERNLNKPTGSNNGTSESGKIESDEFKDRYKEELERVEFSNDWIEFNPTVNEERRIVEHEMIFGSGSKFFVLEDELKYLEDEDLEKGLGMSLRNLIDERIYGLKGKK
ncbi:hypothetical protein BY996DRAFT_6731539 [Phakopsora pachyrhizi]|uniref:Uncharacterized protein n=1 Tax=Phakopsora pachyrhizi TaxID=170000 RepID=A0AAV0AVS9_PHAPC|nr:hypothetical protein BY996DRAFT_6731539 [Phakopsora pachyrhizi]CAH7673311.1 hypothetical protein PPACK8108_LOCUS8199 [Phakopsora pachyrhizi]